MTLAIRLLSAGAITSGVVGTAGVIYLKPWEKSASVKQELEKLRRTILTSKDDSRWEVKVHVYTNIVSKDPSLKINEKGNITIEELSNWCVSSLEKSNSEDLYEKAKELCLAPSVKDKLSKEGKTILNDLTSKLQTYQQYNSNDDKKIPVTQINNKESANLQKSDLEFWCDTYSKVELSNGTDSNYDRIVKWCTN